MSLFAPQRAGARVGQQPPPARPNRFLVAPRASLAQRPSSRDVAPVQAVLGSSARTPVLRTLCPARLVGSARRRTTLRVQAVFEKFSERSIKSVMIAQAEAKAFGTQEVRGRVCVSKKEVLGVARVFAGPCARPRAACVRGRLELRASALCCKAGAP